MTPERRAEIARLVSHIGDYQVVSTQTTEAFDVANGEWNPPTIDTRIIDRHNKSILFTIDGADEVTQRKLDMLQFIAAAPAIIRELLAEVSDE